MAMYNPPHPGEFIASVYLEPNGIRSRARDQAWRGAVHAESHSDGRQQY